MAGQLTARTEGGITYSPRPAIPADRGEALIRLTAIKGPAALPPLLMKEADLLTWIGRPSRTRNDE